VAGEELQAVADELVDALKRSGERVVVERRLSKMEK